MAGYAITQPWKFWVHLTPGLQYNTDQGNATLTNTHKAARLLWGVFGLASRAHATISFCPSSPRDKDNTQPYLATAHEKLGAPEQSEDLVVAFLHDVHLLTTS